MTIDHDDCDFNLAKFLSSTVFRFVMGTAVCGKVVPARLSLSWGFVFFVFAS